MAEKMNGKVVSESDMRTCACGASCTCGCGHRMLHRVLWWVLAVVILGFVFCMGVAAGHLGDRLRATYGGYYNNEGYPMMMRGGYYYNNGYGAGAIPPTATPVSGTSTAPKAQ